MLLLKRFTETLSQHAHFDFETLFLYSYGNKDSLFDFMSNTFFTDSSNKEHSSLINSLQKHIQNESDEGYAERKYSNRKTEAKETKDSL
jgi:hypothetical protein